MTHDYLSSVALALRAQYLGHKAYRPEPVTVRNSRGKRDHASGLVTGINSWWLSNARATLDKQSCVITSTLFEMNSTCMRWCDLNFSCLSTSITSAEVSSCQNKRRYPNPIWPTVFTFRVFKLSFCEFTTMVSLHLHKSTKKK